MKKFLLSSFVILTFIIYSLRQHVDSAPVRSPPSSNSIAPNTNNNAIQTPTGKYKDGQYTGGIADALYGNVQVKAIIASGKINDVQFLDYPHDRRTSIEINTQAMPYLKSEAIQAQSAQVDIISGATQTSEAFIESLQSALTQAQK